MLILLVLHIFTLFTAISVLAAQNVLLVIAARRRAFGAMAALGSLASGPIGPGLFMLGGLFGLATGISFGYGLTAGWLLASYALFGLIVVFGVAYTGPLLGRIASLAADPTGASRPELERLVGRPLGVDTAASFGLMALVIGDMVLKPFS